MSKALSNGTLSLRFMQNAQRAKQLAQVEAEQAKVQDEAEWEIPQELKEQWGIASSSSSESQSRSRDNVTSESSYMPFIFSSGEDAHEDAPRRAGLANSQFKGRRKFDTRGREVVAAANPPSEAQDDKPPEEDGKGSPGKKPARLMSISGFQAPLSTKSETKRTETVQMLVRKIPGRGVRQLPPLSRVSVSGSEADTIPASTAASSTPAPITEPQASVGFMKPAGVDASTAASSKKGKPADSGSSTNTKRARTQDSSGTAGKDGKKRKKSREDGGAAL